MAKHSAPADPAPAATAAPLAPKGTLSVDKAAALKAELLDRLAGQAPLVVELSGVEDIDLACLQVLIAARRSALALSRGFHLAGSLAPRVARKLASAGFARGVPERAEELEAAMAVLQDGGRP